MDIIGQWKLTLLDISGCGNRTVSFYISVITYYVWILLFVSGVPSHMIIFHSYGWIITTGEGLYFRAILPALPVIEQWEFLSVPHLYCESGLGFSDLWYSHLLTRVCQWNGHYLFIRPTPVADLGHFQRHSKL